jgi:hypothetical protein
MLGIALIHERAMQLRTMPHLQQARVKSLRDLEPGTSYQGLQDGTCKDDQPFSILKSVERAFGISDFMHKLTPQIELSDTTVVESPANIRFILPR